MKRIITVILCMVIIFAFPVNAHAEEGVSIEDYSKSSILMCADTGDIIYENNAYEQLSPASVTKLMSILLCLEALDDCKISLDDTVTAGEDAVSKGGSQIWLEVGESMTVDELLKAVVVASANDACTALGEYISGSSSAFVDAMNTRASELNLKNTHFENCTGLDDTTQNHYSCAYDLAIIAKEILNHKLIFQYSTIWLDYLRDGKTELNNTNKLINKYNGITGMKTGTTSKAGFCVCATAQRDNMSLISVVLGAKTSEERFKSAANMLDFGFSQYEIIAPQIDNNQIREVKIKNGKSKAVKPIYNDASIILVKKGSGEISCEYDIVPEVSAPISKGSKLGNINIKSNDSIIKTIELYSPSEIERISYEYIFKILLKTI